MTMIYTVYYSAYDIHKLGISIKYFSSCSSSYGIYCEMSFHYNNNICIYFERQTVISRNSIENLIKDNQKSKRISN
jgi:hypothetical protein